MNIMSNFIGVNYIYSIKKNYIKLKLIIGYVFEDLDKHNLLMITNYLISKYILS